MVDYLTITTGNLVALAGVMLLLSVVPGPSDIAVVARAITGGLRAAVYMVLGIVVADLVFIVVALWGLATIYHSFGGLFLVVQWLCAGYLAWLGVNQWRSAAQLNEQSFHQASRWSGFITGLLITFADPKAIVFYMGLLPAFVDIARVTFMDAVAIMLAATVVICGVKLGYAVLADRASGWFRNTTARRWLNRSAGAALLAIAALVAHGAGLPNP